MTIETTLRETSATALELDVPLVLDEATPVQQVITRMLEQHLGYSLLTRDGDLSGVFTERDLVQRVLCAEQGLERPISEFMTPSPSCVEVTASVSAVIERMLEGGFRHVVIVGPDGQIVGCVRHRDIVSFLAQAQATQILNLPPDPEQVALTQEGA